jgi:hypothetical protein
MIVADTYMVVSVLTERLRNPLHFIARFATPHQNMP